MLKPKRIIYIFLLCVVLGLVVRFSCFYLIGQEGLKYFSIIKGIVQLNTTDTEIVKLSNNPEEYVFKAKNQKDIERMIKEQGFEGGEYYKAVKYITQDRHIRTSMRMFSSKYIILTYTTMDKSN